MSFRFKVLDWWGRRWGRAESWLGALLGRLRRKKRQLGAEARLIGAEVIHLGVQVWDRIDDLPFVHTSLKLTPIRTQFYGHGAFMGAAPALIADAKWRRILAFLMPDVFTHVRAELDRGAPPTCVIPMLENNPVLAAFGVYRAATGPRGETDESPHHLSGLEWDVFVDLELLADWEVAKTDPVARAKVMERVLDTALIAHASATDTLQEAMGMCQYRDLRKTPKSALGGVEMDSWLDYFGRALSLAQAPDLDALVAEMAKEPRAASEEECMRETFAQPWPVRRVVEVHAAVTGKPCVSVIVEIKSLRSTPEFLSELVRMLNAQGVHVAAVASFLREEVEGVSATIQNIDGTPYPAPREIQFFHFAGDLQEACDEGRVAGGQSVLFNGASLIETKELEGKEPVYSTKLRVVSELEEYRERLGLHIGLYVQEGDCDHAAAMLLSDLIDARSQTFELGFAWGGLRDEVHVPSSTQVRVGYGSQRLLEYVGKAKQWKLRGAQP